MRSSSSKSRTSSKNSFSLLLSFPWNWKGAISFSSSSRRWCFEEALSLWWEETSRLLRGSPIVEGDRLFLISFPRFQGVSTLCWRMKFFLDLDWWERSSFLKFFCLKTLAEVGGAFFFSYWTDGLVDPFSLESSESYFQRAFLNLIFCMTFLPYSFLTCKAEAQESSFLRTELLDALNCLIRSF